MGIPGGSTGKISWFGGPGDSSSGPTTASGASVSVPGIAFYSHSTLGGYWLVRMPNGREAVLKQTDVGPAPWTGRKVDFTYTALPKLGYSTGNFPTDASIQYKYLGKNVPGQYAHLVIGAGGSATAPGGGGGNSNSLGPMPKIPGLPAIPPGITFDAKGYQHARAQALLANLQKQTGSLFSASSPGSIPEPSMPQLPDPSKFLQLAQNHLQQMAGNSTALKVHPGAVPGFKGQYVNPIKGFSVGRTDQGVDASARPGTPIRALGDSRLVQVLPDWYSGQPLLLFKLLNGPKAGQYWYVAEQISPTTTQIGHVFHAGDAVGRFASSGTGIEIGWGSPTSNARTLAGATTGYSEGQVTPAGTNFRNFIGSL